jgi:hypothetical protein
MEPANEPIPFDRLEPRARGGSMQGCVQAMVRHAPRALAERFDGAVDARIRPMPLLQAAACLAMGSECGITVLLQAGGDAMAVQDRMLAALAHSGSMRARTAVRIACSDPSSVEPEDLRAIADAVQRGQCPLLAEVRATWRLQAVGDGVDLRAPDTATAVPLLADAIARYAAEQLEESRASIAPPDHGLVERLLAITGSVLIRPVETQVWAGFLEMGIGTDPEGRERPCETTLLYDRPSGTWHMEP